MTERFLQHGRASAFKSHLPRATQTSAHGRGLAQRTVGCGRLARRCATATATATATGMKNRPQAVSRMACVLGSWQCHLAVSRPCRPLFGGSRSILPHTTMASPKEKAARRRLSLRTTRRRLSPDYLLTASLAAVTAAEAASVAAVAAVLAAAAASVTAAEAASPTAAAPAEAASTAAEAASAALLAAEAAASAAEAAESATGAAGSAGVSVLLQPTMAIEANRANRSDLFISQFLFTRANSL